MEKHNCSICHIQNKEAVPVVWCPHCLEYLCSICEHQHRVMRLSRDHVTIPYDDYCKLPPFILNADLNCQEHNEKYQYFCKSHDGLCCVKCLLKSHKKCDDIPVIDEIIRNVKASAGFEDAWRELHSTHETYNVAIETSEKNLRHIETQKKALTKRVKEKSNQLIDKIRAIETQTLLALDSVVTEITDKINTTKKILRLKETNLNALVGHKTSIETLASDFQAFIGIKYIWNAVTETQKSLQSLCKNENWCKWEVILEEHDDLEDVIFAVENFGDIRLVKESTTILLNEDQPNRAQSTFGVAFPPQLRVTQEFKLDNCCNNGCCALPNGVMAFASDNVEVKITKSDGSLKSTVKFTGDGVDDVTMIDDNHIAVSNSQSKTISIIDVVSSEVIKILKTQNEISGITHHDGYIYFCVPRKGIMKINVETEKVEAVRDDESVGTNSRLDTDGKRLCYTCFAKDTVTVLDFYYQEIFTYSLHNERVLDGPTGISFDQHQNIIVCNHKDNILLISRDGDKVETFATKSDGLEYPTCIHYCVNAKSLLVVGLYGDVRKYAVN